MKKRCTCTEDMRLPDGCERMTYVSEKEEFPIAVRPYEGDQLRRVAADVKTGKPLEPRQVLIKTSLDMEPGKFVLMHSYEAGLKGSGKTAPEYLLEKIQELVDSGGIASDPYKEQRYIDLANSLKGAVFESKQGARSFIREKANCTEAQWNEYYSDIEQIVSRYEVKIGKQKQQKDENDGDGIIVFEGRKPREKDGKDGDEIVFQGRKPREKDGKDEKIEKKIRIGRLFFRILNHFSSRQPQEVLQVKTTLRLVKAL